MIMKTTELLQGMIDVCNNTIEDYQRQMVNLPDSSHPSITNSSVRLFALIEGCRLTIAMIQSRIDWVKQGICFIESEGKSGTDYIFNDGLEHLGS